MITKTEALYRALLPLAVVTSNEAIRLASQIVPNAPDREYLRKKYVARLVKSGKLWRVRKGLYLVLFPTDKPDEYMPDKILIASKVRREYYLGYHTALEYYGCAQSLYNEAYICVKPKHRFRPFSYKRLNFRPVFTEDTNTAIETKYYQETPIKVSSRERTFLDCIDKVQYAGGWEECIKSLEGLSHINPEKLLRILIERKKDKILRRAGYVLELLRNRSSFYEQISDQLLTRIRTMTKGPPRYLIQGEKGPLNKKWNLYIPEDFEEKLRGI
jgi:predicted transcriptional regulator of viral defense system